MFFKQLATKECLRFLGLAESAEEEQRVVVSRLRERGVAQG